jgi:hypothetical protein
LSSFLHQLSNPHLGFAWGHTVEKFSSVKLPYTLVSSGQVPQYVEKKKKKKRTNRMVVGIIVRKSQYDFSEIILHYSFDQELLRILQHEPANRGGLSQRERKV